MHMHTRKPTQEVKFPCLPHDNQTSFGIKISAFLLGQYLLSECPRTNRKDKFWMKETQIQKFQLVEWLKPKVHSFLNNRVGNMKKKKKTQSTNRAITN